MAVLLEKRPKNTGHREVHANIKGIGQYSRQFFLPETCRSVPATWTSSRLASVTNEQTFGSRRIEIAATLAVHFEPRRSAHSLILVLHTRPFVAKIAFPICS